jgi:hypothetical protein
MGRKTTPPEMPATRKDPLFFVCGRRPQCRRRPRNPEVKIVAKQQLSKQKTSISNSILVLPDVVIAVMEIIKHIPRYVVSMYPVWQPGSSSKLRLKAD